MIIFTLNNKPISRSPREFGANVEINDNLGESNLLDWLLDSGSTIIREFHPEKSLRRPSCNLQRFQAIAGVQEFEAFRTRLISDPGETIPWGDYLFDEAIPWMGIPDTIVEKLVENRLKPICSLGYYPKLYSSSLLLSFKSNSPVPDDQLDWGAVASCYEYFLAEIFRYARMGVDYFSIHNEAEQSEDRFHLPGELGQAGFEGDVNLSDSGKVFDERKHAALGMQLGILNRFARLAMDDAKRLLGESSPDLQLCGLCSAMGFYYIPHILPYADVVDFHCYSEKPDEFVRKGRMAIEMTRDHSLPVALTEFNRKGGSMRIEEMLFNMTTALEVAVIFETLFKLAQPDEKPLELLTFYLFAGPSTHRNYKHLVYGDMNLLDWTGCDKGLTNMGCEWYPDLEELQLRFATPAYAIYKMFARMAHSHGGRKTNTVLELVLQKPVFSGAENLRFLAVEGSDLIYLLFINQSPEQGTGVHLNLRQFYPDYAFAAIRESSLCYRDELREARALSNGFLAFEAPPESVIQVMLTKEDYSATESLELVEATATPGNCREGLDLHQTTRLRAFGKVNGQRVDLTDRAIIWRSSHPDLVRIDGGGLVQRVRRSEQAITLSAAIPNGPVAELQL